MFRYYLNEQLRKYIREVRIERNKADIIDIDEFKTDDV